jgi:glycosyltransferase involved in cell wall biosynthesis
MISIIVPAYNEGKRIEDTLRRIQKVPGKKEIIVIDDGSKDDTAKRARKHARVLRHKTNQGKGEAMRTGAKAAKGDTLVFIDASQFYPSQIPVLVNRMKKDKADMVVGVRDFSVIPWHRRMTNNLTKLAIFMGTGRRIGDALSGFRVIGRRQFLALNTLEKKYCIESEINFKIFNRKMKVSEVSVKVSYIGENAVKKLGGIRTFWKQRFAHEALFNVRAVLRCWAGRF